MSSRIVQRFAPAALLVAALAAPVAAQEARPVAPMPREKTGQTIEIELDFTFSILRARVSQTKTGAFPTGRAPAVVAPMPRPKAEGVRISVPPLGPLPLSLDAPFPLTRTPDDNRQVFSSGGVFGGEGWSDPAAVAPMSPPMQPEVPVSPMVAPQQPGVFVIGVGGLQRVMPMPEPPRFLVAPTPVPTGSFVIEIGSACPAPVPFGPALVKHARDGCFLVGVCGTERPLPNFVPATAPRPIGAFGVTNVAYEMCPPCPLPVATNPLSGTWYRDAGIAVIAVTFVGDEMTVRVSQRDDEKTVTFTLTAHCTVTKDGLVHGAITSADVDVKWVGKPDPEFGMELAAWSLRFQELTDQPFSFRTKATPVGLMVSHLKAASFEGLDGKELAILGGLYKCAKDGKVPELKSLKTTGGRGRCDCAVPVILDVPVSTPYASGPVIERIGIDFTPPTMGQPVVPAGAVPAPTYVMPQPVRPVSCAPPAGAMKQMVGEVFGEMIWSPGPFTAQAVPPGLIPHAARPVACAPPADAMKQMAVEAFQQMFEVKLPAPRHPEHCPDPGYPERYNYAANQTVVAPFGVQQTNGSKPGAVGTWYREFGTKRCVVKVAADHLTLTVLDAQEVNGKVVTGSLIITADYRLARDGQTAVGLITSVDLHIDGDLPTEESVVVINHLEETQKALEDKPFALIFRVYDDALVIGNVRMPNVGDRMEVQPAGYLGGRYKSAGDKPLPKLKVVKATLLPVPFESGPASRTPGRGLGAAIGTREDGGYAPYPGGTNQNSGSQGELLPPQNLGSGGRSPYAAPPRPEVELPPIPLVEAIPAPVVRVIEATVTIPEPLPSMTVPTAPVPTMPEPIAPTASAAPKAIPATEMAVAWDKKITSLPDPTRNGAPTPGIRGQLFLYGGPNLQFAPAAGTLTVDLIDETPRPAGRPAAKPERWQIDQGTLSKLITKDEAFGECYTLFLPWPGDHSDVTKVKLTARYDPDSGHTLYAAPPTVSLVPTMPKPVAPPAPLRGSNGGNSPGGF